MKKSLRIAVYEKFNGHCAYCGKVIEYKEMQVDHIIPKDFNGTSDNFDNLNPSCRRCNHYKRAHLLKDFRLLLKTLHERIRQNYICKVAEDYGVIEIKPWDGIFYFEKEDPDA